MTEFEVLPCPPNTSPDSIVDDTRFTDVTDEGEIYRTYRIIRFVYEFAAHPQGWTHMAVVVAERDVAEVEAFLRVVDRCVDESYIVPASD